MVPVPALAPRLDGGGDLGTILYAIADTHGALGRALAGRDAASALPAAGDLCHYLGDLTQPLHNTVNYRGQLSGNAICHQRGDDSVHERFESLMVGKFHKELGRRIESKLEHLTSDPQSERREPI